MQHSRDQDFLCLKSVVDHIVADQCEPKPRSNLIAGLAEFRVVANHAKLLGHAESHISSSSPIVSGDVFDLGVTGVPGLVVEGLVVTRNASLGKTRV